MLTYHLCFRISNIFVIGEGTKSWVSLPKGKGIKLTIAEESCHDDGSGFVILTPSLSSLFPRVCVADLYDELVYVRPRGSCGM